MYYSYMNPKCTTFYYNVHSIKPNTGISPCVKCQEREFKCHSCCDSFKAWHSRHEASLKSFYEYDYKSRMNAIFKTFKRGGEY